MSKQRRITVKTAVEIRKRAVAGQTVDEIAAAMKLYAGHVARVVRGSRFAQVRVAGWRPMPGTIADRVAR